MRLFAYLFFVIGVGAAFAAEPTLRTIIQDGRPAYLLSFGDYAQEKDALAQQALLIKISAPYKVTLEPQNDLHHFALKIGPIRHYHEAQKLQKHLSETTLSQLSPTPILSPSSPAPLAPSDATAPPLPKEANLWNLNQADIRAVIGEISRLTGKNFIIDPRVQGKISIVSNTPLSNKALYKVFLSMLQVSGYSAITEENSVKIIPNLDAKAYAPAEKGKKGDAVMISVVPVHYVPAEQLVPVLRPLMPQWSYVSSYGPSNMLILAGRAHNIKQLTRIIKQVDSSSANGIDVVRLRYALAMDMAQTLKDLIKTNTPNAAGLSIAVDDRNNALLVSGNKTDRLRLRIIISKLDRYSPHSEGATRVIYLHYLRATDLVPILAGIAQANFSGIVGTTIGTVTIPILDSTNPTSSIVDESNGSPTPQISPTPTVSPAAGQASAAAANTTATTTQNEGSTKPKVQIIAEPNTNSIIINAPPHIIHTLERIIAQLDIRPAQILIEALVAEINETDIENLGIQWGSLGQSGNAAQFRPGFAIINSKTALSDFQAQLYALETEQKANVLSTPSVVVLDNRQAKILIGQQVSVASTSYPNNAGGTTTASPYSTFNRVNVALHLYVRPQITRAGGIQLQIDQGNDTIDRSSVNNSFNPTFNISSIVTSIHINTGDVVVLGGLMEGSLANSNTDVPVLNKIPGLGRLFQQNITTKSRRVLMVFIRPIILNNAQDQVEISGEKYHDIRAIELADVRSQEKFDPTNRRVIMPPLHQSHLPIPFTQSTMASK